MLVLSRREGESIKLAEVDVEIRVVGLRRSKVQLGIEAPAELTIRRGELPQRTSPSTDQAEDQRLDTELTRLETELIALAELAAAKLSRDEDRDHVRRITADASARLKGIRRSIQASTNNDLQRISELVSVRTDVIDRLRLGSPTDLNSTDQVRQTTAGYRLSSACGVG